MNYVPPKTPSDGLLAEIQRLKNVAAYNEVRADANTIRADKLEEQCRYQAKYIIYLEAVADVVRAIMNDDDALAISGYSEPELYKALIALDTEYE